jgi:cytochrome P450
MKADAPPRVSFNPLRRIAGDLQSERASVLPLPPGDLRPSFSRTTRFAREPLPILLDAYERHGPIFSLRIFHGAVVFMLGPAANRHVLVSNAANFRWRDGSFGDLIPLLGDGLLTTDGAYHRRARRLLLPAFHHEQVAAAVDTMVEEAGQALDEWHPGRMLDAYAWTRRLALRIAMRALLGLDPDATGEVDAAREWERALSFYGRDYFLQSLRGPRTPWAQMIDARRRLDSLLLPEIARRRREGPGEGLLGLLLHATDEAGDTLDDRQLRDQVITLLFAGHDTTTSTVAFLLHELGRHPEALERLLAEQDRVLGGRVPSASDLAGGLPELDLAVDETLRLYPPAWVGPRRAVEAFEFAGHVVPAGTPVNYCSWASHRLPDVFPDPHAFRPQRFAPEARAQMPKGAYVPFGGGSRTCIGMRFGLMEVKAIATMVLQRFGWEPWHTGPLTIRQQPTLSPRYGLPLTVTTRS